MAAKSTPTTRKTVLRPQEGPQEAFLSTPADIAIYGGAAFSGKTWALLLEGLRHIRNPGFGFVIFRRTSPQIRNEGGLWDESETLYPLVGGLPKESLLEWEFPSGARGKFAHLEHEKNKYDWQGAQIPYIGFDELPHFSRGQFFYLLSRNRSTCGVRPYVRATCNPDPDSFVAELVSWWIDPDSGYPIPERSGVVRWFIREDEELVWADSRQELATRYPHIDPATDGKSFTFIAARLEDNRIGMEKDPGYAGMLRALPRVDRLRLLQGNWKVRPAAGQYFQRGYFQIVEQAPAARRRARGWDLASTDETEGGDPSWTVGVRMSRGIDGFFYVEHVERFRGSPAKVEQVVQGTASQDGVDTHICLPQDPGQAGKSQVQSFTRLLAGFRVKSRPMSGDKVMRAGPFSAQAEAGLVRLVRGPWNEAFLAEVENFPAGPADQVDAAVEAFDELVHGPEGGMTKLGGF